jgi:hypothetical protein
MLIKRKKGKRNFFENLIIKVDSLEKSSAYILKYTPNKKTEYIEKHNSFNFSGAVSVTAINYNKIKGIAAKNQYSCYQVTEIWCSWTDYGNKAEHVASGACFSNDHLYGKPATECGFMDDGTGAKSDDFYSEGGITSGGGDGINNDLGENNENDPNQLYTIPLDCKWDCPDEFDEDDDQIFNELNDDCAKGIFEVLEKESPLGPTVNTLIVQSFSLSGEILNMFKHSDKFKYTVKNGTYSNNANTSSFSNMFTTTISDAYLSKATKLSIARTMIHESVHAYILYNIKPRVNTDFRDAIKVYADKYPVANRYHHEFMAEYVKAMAISLYTWDKNNGGGSLGYDYYEAMAYGGLFYPKKDSQGNILKDSQGNVIIEETDSFKKLEPIKLQRDRIKQILYNEQQGNTNAKGIKCN